MANGKPGRPRKNPIQPVIEAMAQEVDKRNELSAIDSDDSLIVEPLFSPPITDESWNKNMLMERVAFEVMRQHGARQGGKIFEDTVRHSIDMGRKFVELFEEKKFGIQ